MKSGKSFLCDKILNLAEINNTFANEDSDIKFYGIPFQKGNMKIFLVECKGFKNEELSNSEKRILDFIMSISSQIVFVPDSSDYENKSMQIAYKNFKNSKARLHNDENLKIWPKTLYYLYRG